MRKKVFFPPLLLLALACSAGKQLVFEQYSLAMTATVEPDSSIYVGNSDKFSGVIRLLPIFENENLAPKSVKLIENYGLYYICADQFKNVWVVRPKSDGMNAGFKALDVTPKDKTDSYTNVNFSRYGSKDKAVVRFRYNGTQIHIDRKGGLNEAYK
jgi:hypothetical protein